MTTHVPKPHEIVPEALRCRFGWDERHDAAAAAIIAKYKLLLPRDRELIRALTFVRVAQSLMMPFGKYKGRLIEDLLDDDPQYLEQLASQSDFAQSHPHLYRLIIENLAAEDVPAAVTSQSVKTELKAEGAVELVPPAVPCCTCGARAHFGYRDKAGEMRWFCAEHRLAQCWADARAP